jgi:hypothetical protein
MSNPVISTNGSKIWYNEYSVYHRLDGPALEYITGLKVWYINGIHIYELRPDGTTSKGDMTDIPDSIKQSIAIETLKVQS